MRYLTVLLLLVFTFPLCAQQDRSWEQILNELMTMEDDDTENWEEIYDQLSELEQHPIDLNSTTREQLAELPFLSEQQIQDMVEYLDRYGPMKSLNELRMISSLDYLQIQLLPYFVTLSEPQQKGFPSLEQIAHYGRHELMGYAKIPFYERKGDKNGYLGYPYKHWLRYTFNYGAYLKAGIVGSQDAGEPFFTNNNRMGYDFYSYYLQLRNLGKIESLVAGKFKVSAGMGLVVNSTYSLGKLATLQQMGRQTNVLRAHSSRSSSGYFQGVGASVNLYRHLQLTAFASARPLDATLSDNGTATTLLTDGYHRTPKEIEKKHNTHALDAGIHLQGRWRAFHAGLTALYTHLDRRLQPNTKTLYRRYDAQGTDFLNMSVNYGYMSHRICLNGETAVNRDGALATLNSLSLRVADGLRLVAIQRYYSYRYTSLYAHSLAEGSRVQNESGIYAGLDWQASPSFRMQLYTDYCYSPWLRYQISQSSYSSDHLAQAVYTRGAWRLQGRYRLRLRQRDNQQKNALIGRTEHRCRLSIGYDGFPHLTLTTQADGTLFKQDAEQQYGWAIHQEATYKRSRLNLNLNIAYFHTDSYDARIYTYERGPLYTFTFPTLYGHGLRYSLMLRSDISSAFMMTAKCGVTNYFDRSVISSGLQEVNGSSLTDIDLQFRWKF